MVIVMVVVAAMVIVMVVFEVMVGVHRLPHTHTQTESNTERIGELLLNKPNSCEVRRELPRHAQTTKKPTQAGRRPLALLCTPTEQTPIGTEQASQSFKKA